MNDEQNNGNGAAAEATPVIAPEPFSAHEAVSNVLGSLNRSPRPESSSRASTVASDTATPIEEPHTGQATAPPPSEPSAPAINLDKQINDLKSENGRLKKEVAGIEDRLRGEFIAQMQQLSQAMLLRNQQQPPQVSPDDGYDRPLTRAEAMQLAQQAADQIVQQRLAADPRLQTAGHIGDWARYREEKQDSSKYDPFITKLLSKFPVPPGGNLHSHLSSAYEFFAELEAEAQALQANRQGEAARANNTPPPQPHPKPQDQAAALMERAQRYRMEQGVSPTAATRPAIDAFGNEEEAIDAMVSAWMRGRR